MRFNNKMVKIYYDTKDLKDWLKVLNPVENWNFFANDENSLFLYLFYGGISILATFLAWLFLPFMFIIPIKFRSGK